MTHNEMKFSIFPFYLSSNHPELSKSFSGSSNLVLDELFILSGEAYYTIEEKLRLFAAWREFQLI